MGDGCCGSIYLAGVAEPESGVTNGVGKERIWRATKCDAAVTGRDYLFRGCDAGALTICYEVSLGLASLGSECSNTVYKLPHLRIRVIASGTVRRCAERLTPSVQAHPEVGTPDGCGSPLPGRTMPPAPRPRVRATSPAPSGAIFDMSEPKLQITNDIVSRPARRQSQCSTSSTTIVCASHAERSCGMRSESARKVVLPVAYRRLVACDVYRHA